MESSEGEATNPWAFSKVLHEFLRFLIITQVQTEKQLKL
jgi:hypothetical protein